MMAHTLILASCLALTGCFRGCSPAAPVNVPTAIPVVCTQTVPERPAMPTEQLAPGGTLDAFTAAATAEIRRREGYEVQLRTALVACTTPLEP